MPQLARVMSYAHSSGRAGRPAGRQARTHKNRVRHYSGNDTLTVAASRQKSPTAASTLGGNKHTAFKNHRFTAATEKVTVSLSPCLVKRQANETYARMMGSGGADWINLAREMGQ